MSRKYSETELRAILEKAVDEEGAAPLRGAVDGLSLDEIKNIGAEVGIDPASLERAARSVDTVPTSDYSALAGAPTSTTVERRVEGALDAVPTHEVVAAIRRGMGRTGTLSELKGLLEWRSDGELGQRVITISSRDGVTSVSGMADMTQAAVVTHLPGTLIGVMGSVGGFLASASSANEVGMVFFAALLPTVLLGVRRIFARISKSEVAKLDRAVEEVAALVEDARDGGSV